MSTSELGELEALLERVLPDPMGYAERVARQLTERLGTDVTAPPPTVVESHDAAEHEALVDRNVLLAAALGACECWGQEPRCTGCGGGGTAGWVPPDPALFEEYVGPAVRRMATGPEPETRPSRPTEHRTESADEQPVAG